MPKQYWIPVTVNKDAQRLKQILFNLVGNAVKFTEQGEVTLTCGLVHRSDGSSCHPEQVMRNPCDFRLRFQVRDTGIGISTGNQSKLFQPFVQADASVTRKFGGTGLGLYLSKQLAQMLGGDLKLVKAARALQRSDA